MPQVLQWHDAHACTLLGPISLLYKQLLQYTLLKSFTVPSALLTKFPKKFHMKLLASDIIFTKMSTKNLSMFKLRCKWHYRNLATYSWCTTWREHVTKTVPTRRRHSVGGGGAQLYIKQHARVCARRAGDGSLERPLIIVCNAIRQQLMNLQWCT